MAQANFRPFTLKEADRISEYLVGLDTDPPSSFSGWEPKRLWHHPAAPGPFEECAYAEGLDSRSDGRSLVAADFDGDGDLDLLMLARAGQRLQYFENGGPRANAVELELVPHSGPREPDAVRVRASGLGVFSTALARGYASSVPPTVHLGLGEQKSVDVEVQWRDGKTERFAGLAAGARHVLEQGKPRPVRSTTFAAPRPPGAPLPWPSHLADLGLKAAQAPTVVQLFLESCKACAKEAPQLSRLAQSKRAVVTGLGMASPEKTLEATARAMGIDYPVQALSEPTADALSTQGELPLPLLLVYGSDGELKRVLRGPEELDGVLAELGPSR